VPEAGPRAALRLIGDRNFGPYFVGNAASASGTWFQNLAAALLVYRLTHHSAFLLGVLNFGNFVPVLVLAPWAGSAADRFDRRRLLLVTQLVSAALSGALAALAWGGLAHVWVVIMFAVALGTMSAFSAPASMALIGNLVPREQLASAVALNSMTFNLARAI
jgi:MFS family permease